MRYAMVQGTDALDWLTMRRPLTGLINQRYDSRGSVDALLPGLG